MKTVKLFIVDDSIAIIQVLEKLLSDAGDIEIVGRAFNGEDAIKKIPDINPDVVLLDVEMPELNGIEVVKYLMQNNPVPILMFSSLTYKGAEVTNKALIEGAVDFMLKPPKWKDIEKIKKELIEKIRIVSRVKVLRRFKAISHKRKRKLPATSKEKIVVIGASTGGPKSLLYLISRLPENLNSTIIVVQHMPETFTAVLASHLNKVSPYPVKEVEDSETLRSSMVYIARGGKSLVFSKKRRLKFIDDSRMPLPSIDTIFESAAEIWGRDVIGVILTGMGQDGKTGAYKIKERGGIIIAESKETAIIYGMPRAVIENRLADYVAPLYQIPEIIYDCLKR